MRSGGRIGNMYNHAIEGNETCTSRHCELGGKPKTTREIKGGFQVNWKQSFT